MTMRRLALEIISLTTASGRITAFSLATTAIFFSKYHWLDHLSLYGHLGIHSPSIGLTRAYWLLIHGHPLASWDRNPLIYAVLCVGIPIIFIDIVRLIKAHRQPESLRSMV